MSLYGFRDNKVVVEGLETKKLSFGDNSFVVSYAIPALSTVASGSILSGWDINAATTVRYGTAYKIQPPYPVTVGVIANSVGSAGATDKVIIVGVNAKGKTVSETVYVQATADGLNYTSNAFARITSLTPYNTAVTIKPKSTSVGVQFGKTLSLPNSLAATADILVFNYGSTSATTSPKNLTFSKTYDTVALPVSGSNKGLLIVYRSGLQ